MHTNHLACPSVIRVSLKSTLIDMNVARRLISNTYVRTSVSETRPQKTPLTAQLHPNFFLI